ncbi:hypothetical protein M378DRAFT_162685 [Amanita muscaria Koide BX008]|uniref:Uncharacterized protein n=1 Tax=Amanita muscaria (strain Koide BX008) TaxID=946122 RepID=A0A0C2SNM1_AMAMK|nr:hypothetical protein M378DRAFT_162685 [Amanita muscaria Koide BX008]
MQVCNLVDTDQKHVSVHHILLGVEHGRFSAPTTYQSHCICHISDGTLAARYKKLKTIVMCNSPELVSDSSVSA